jgi:hypothetical protein
MVLDELKISTCATAGLDTFWNIFPDPDENESQFDELKISTCATAGLDIRIKNPKMKKRNLVPITVQILFFT